MGDNEDKTARQAPPSSAPDPEGKRPSGPHAIAGPLVVSAANPRYFAAAPGDAAGRAIYLAGSHIWNNLHDGMGPGAACADTAEAFDYEALPRFLATARAQLHPALALGAIQVAGRRR
jgi:hypothetical protein